MKIGIDIRLRNETGVGRYIRNLVRQLHAIDEKNEYVLFTRSYEGLEWIQKKQNWRIVLADVAWHSVSEQVTFFKIVNDQQLDLMHFPYFSLPVMYNRPFVITIHDLIIHHFPTGKASTLPLPLYKAKYFGYKAIITHAAQRAQKIIVPLYATEDDVIKTLGVPPKKVVVTYEGIDADLLSSIDTDDETFLERYNLQHNSYFLYVGNAYPHKNIETIVKGFQLFIQKNAHSNSTCVFVGKDDFFYRRLQKMLSKNEIKDMLFFHDIDDGKLRTLYHHATSVVSASFMEGFGLVPLEAMAANCLVVASDIPAHREVGADALLYFNPHDPRELAECLRKVCEMPEKKKKEYLKAGKARLPLFSWRSMAKETIAVYESSISVRQS